MRWINIILGFLFAILVAHIFLLVFSINKLGQDLLNECEIKLIDRELQDEKNDL